MISELITNELNKLREKFAYQITDVNWGSWTLHLKETIAKIPFDKHENLDKLYSNLATCASGNSEFFAEGEWLYDLVWYEMDRSVDVSDGMHVMKSIPLVMESEMSKKDWGGFKEDFDKLLVASASTKLFVTCKKKNESEENGLKKKLDYAQKAVNSFVFCEQVDVIVWNEEFMHIDEPFELIKIKKNEPYRSKFLSGDFNISAQNSMITPS